MNSLFNLTAKKAIVTGPSGNIGPIWMETLRDAGAQVIGMDIMECDVSNKEQVSDFVNDLLYDNCNTIDIVVNNAAIDNPPHSKASFWGNFEEIIKVNLIGAKNVSEAFLPFMRNGGGRDSVIVNVGSIMGFIGADWRNYDAGFEKPSGYNVSKAALMQLSRSITTQYGRYGVRGVTIAFGPYDNGKFDERFREKFMRNVPLGRGVSTDSLRQTLLFAVCCKEFAGQTVLVDGGYTSW